MVSTQSSQNSQNGKSIDQQSQELDLDIKKRIAKLLEYRQQLEVLSGVQGLNHMEVINRSTRKSIQREDLAAAKAMGWPELSESCGADDEMQAHFGDKNSHYHYPQQPQKKGLSPLVAGLIGAGTLLTGGGAVGLGAWVISKLMEDKPNPIVDPIEGITLEDETVGLRLLRLEDLKE